jgi:hypothetical protein
MKNVAEVRVNPAIAPLSTVLLLRLKNHIFLEGDFFYEKNEDI